MIDISEIVETIYNGFDSNLVTIRTPFSIKDNLNDLGHCYKSENFYKVEVPLTGNDYVDDCLKMHEYGHIYLGHLDGLHEELDENLSQIINNKRQSLVEVINENCNIDYADKLLDKVIKDKGLNHMIHNISMDMEVNSSILNYDDCELIQSTVRDLVFDKFKEFVDDKCGEGKKVPDKLRKLFEIKLISPRDFKFEEGLKYPDYLVQVILNLDLFVNLMSNKLNSNEDSSEEGDGNESNSSNNGNVPKTLEEFLEMIGSNSTEGDEGQSEDESKNKNETEGNKDGSEKKDKKDHSSPSREKSDEKRDQEGYCNPTGRGSSTSTTVRVYNVNKDPLDMALEEIIRDVRQKVIKRDLIRDHVYKYNRKILGKTNSNILSPTYIHRVTKSEDPTIVYIIDVSGSMNTTLVDRIITTLRYFMKKLNSSLLYNIIAWDTELKQHYKNIGFSSPIPKLSCRGGTRLAGAFEFFKKEYGKEAVMVLISDFEDDLYQWNKMESSMTGYSMYGLDYGLYNTDNYPKFKNFKVRKCNQ